LEGDSRVEGREGEGYEEGAEGGGGGRAGADRGDEEQEQTSSPVVARGERKGKGKRQLDRPPRTDKRQPSSAKKGSRSAGREADKEAGAKGRRNREAERRSRGPEDEADADNERIPQP